MKKGFLKLSIVLTFLACVSVHTKVVAESKHSYKNAQLSFVDLSDSAKITAQAVVTESVKLRKVKGKDAAIVVDLNTIIHPDLSGIGGAFNEQGGDAFMYLSEADQKTLAEALFSPVNGSGFSMCRTAVGSSDFGLSAYSYSEVPDDYEMRHFSVDRDTRSVLPFIRAAKAENEDLQIFASPWSPPGWMKISGKMDGGLPGDTTNVLKADPEIYKAYALYFSKYLKEYAKNGAPINRLIIQNETDMNPRYPGCNMLPEQMAELVSAYIRPQFTREGIKTEIWAGSFRDVDQPFSRPDAHNFMKLEGAKDVSGVGLQYCTAETMTKLRNNHPHIKMMHTEGVCYDGQNSIQQARRRFSEVAQWLNGGLDNYCYWNMVLNEEGKSGWDWKQNCLININRQTKEVIYNPDYAPISLLSRYIRPGDQCLKVETEKGDVAIAVRNAYRVVVFVENQGKMANTKNINLEGKVYAVELPAQSLCAVVFDTEDN